LGSYLSRDVASKVSFPVLPLGEATGGRFT